jgi:four helix bundle protein
LALIPGFFPSGYVASRRRLRDERRPENIFAFGVSIVGFTKSRRDTQMEHVMSKQLLRSGTAIGALVREAEQAESRADFAHKLSIASKEANEAAYWIELLHGQTTWRTQHS